MYLLPIQTKLKFKKLFEGWQDCEVIKQKLIKLKHSMRLKYSMFGSVVSLAMFYIKGRERGTEAFSFLRFRSLMSHCQMLGKVESGLPVNAFLIAQIIA